VLTLVDGLFRSANSPLQGAFDRPPFGAARRGLEAAMLMRVVVFLLVGLGLGAGAALAADDADRSKPSSCAFVRSIDRWEPIDEESVFLYTSPKRKYKVTFMGKCREMKWAIFARLETRPSGGMCLSVADTITFGHGLLRSNRHEFEERCVIKAVEAVPMEGSDDRAEEAPAPQ
jgi:Family of unknown function (DUF6491)